MRIGIITLYNADYGSFFQAASLYDQLEKMGYSCELIHILNREKYIVKNLAGTLIARYFPALAKIIADKINPYRSFMVLSDSLKQFRVSEVKFSMRKISKTYDCVIIGADELWSAQNSYVKYIRTYYGYHIVCPHISYATSGIGLGNPPQKVMEQIVTDLSTFSALGVRDRYTVEWVSTLTQKPCNLVLDPTLLDPYFVRLSRNGDYVLLYGETFEPLQQEAIMSFARKKHWGVRSVSWRQPWCDFVSVESAEELIEQFAGAAWCMVSTYHGTIFSVLQKKKFTAFDTEHRGEKVKDLLRELDLEQCLFREQEIEDVPIDYEYVDSILEGKRKESLEYLQNAIEKVRTIS